MTDRATDELVSAEAILARLQDIFRTELDNDAANGLYRSYAPTEDETMQFYVFRL